VLNRCSIKQYLELHISEATRIHADGKKKKKCNNGFSIQMRVSEKLVVSTPVHSKVLSISSAASSSIRRGFIDARTTPPATLPRKYTRRGLASMRGAADRRVFVPGRKGGKVRKGI
jgi:hypothetical protein